MSIRRCKCTSEELNAAGGYSRCANPEITYAGAVLATGEHNYHDDSDFYAVVWDAAEGRVREVEYATTRGWTYHNGADIDATDDVKAAALAWYRELWERFAIDDAREEAVTVKYGRRVRSTTKRGKNVGVVGVAKWFGEAPVRYGITLDDEQRIGVQVEGERGYRFVNRKSLEVVDPAPVDEDAIRERAKTVEPANWISAKYVGWTHAMLARI